jgi:outer membrane protein TolC
MKQKFKTILLLVLLIGGCKTFDGDAVRKKHAAEYQQEIQERTQEFLPEGEKLNLEDCIQIALKNNLNVKSSQIQSNIAKLQRKVSFANFLPSIELDYQYTRWDPQPKINFAGSSRTMHDERIREITFQAQLSIFNPATWFMYSMYVRGQEIAEIVTEYTKQMTVLKVTVLYYHCMSLQQYEHALNSQLEAETELEKEIIAFHEEGMVSDWQHDQASVLVQAQRLEIDKIQRALEQAKADLLATMGLSPFIDISLKGQDILKEPEEPLEDLILEALLSNPRLRISDREIAIEQEKVKLAISNFLPVLIGFAGRANTSDSFQRYSTYWITGLTGVLSLFDGFANINEYEAAKERKKDVYIQREQLSLVLMVEVLRAHLNLKTAAGEVELAEKNFLVVSKHWEEVKQNWNEGLVNSSEMLGITAEKDIALMLVENTRFQYQVTLATLLNLTGRTDIEIKDSENEL